MKRLIVVLLLLIAWQSQSQVFKEIEIDSISKTAKQTLPFDEPVTFKIPVKEEPKAVFVISYKSYKNYENELKNIFDDFEKIQSPTELKVIDKKKYLFVNHGSAVDFKKNLQPSSNVLIFLFDTDEKGFEIMRNFHLQRMTDVDSLLTLLNYQNSEQIQADITFAPKGHKDNKIKELGTQTKPLFAKLDTIDKKLDSLQKFIFTSKRKTYPCLCDFVCFDTCLQTNSLDSGIIQTLSKLPLLLSDSYLKSTANGEKNFIDLLTIPAKTIDNKTRLANFQNSYKQIEQFNQILTMLSLCHPDSCLIQIIELFDKLKNHTYEYSKLINLRTHTENEIKTMIDNSLLFMKVDIARGSTDIYGMKTRSSFRINPDFGLVYYGFQKDFWGLSPYAGIQINIRSINKDLPFRAYWRRPYSLLSFSLGYSINQLKADNKRTDFFTKGSLMTGAGIKFCQSVRVTTGAMWFYAENPNPVITKKELKYTPYLGLSVDLSIAELLHDFKSLVTNSPF